MKIDIIIPYLDSSDKEWQKDYNYYRDLEINAGIQKPTNTQAFGVERLRDWDNFNYWFRGVEKNCPWINKIFLVVQRKSQIPTWLNTNHPKLRIVLHEEFIPAEFLPTFNPLLIETFYYRIPDLGEYFITSNDDLYFINPIPEDLFFKDNKVYLGKTYNCGRYIPQENEVWAMIIEHNHDFFEQYIAKKHLDSFYHYSHLFTGQVKSFEIDFMTKYYDIIHDAFIVSKFRHPNNYVLTFLFTDTMKYTNYGILSDRQYEKSTYVAVSSRTNFDELLNCEMVCLNDCPETDFEKTKTKVLDFLESIFPEKSSFEK